MTKDQLIESATAFLGMMTIQAQQALADTEEGGGTLRITLDDRIIEGDEAMTVLLETQRPIAEMMVDYLIADGLVLEEAT